MRRVVLTRLAAALPLLLGVSLISFLLLHLAPGTFLDRLRLNPAVPRQTLETLLHRYGLGRPWYEQYLSWLAGVLKGDLGFSLAFERPVSQLLGESAVYTVALVVAAGSTALIGGVAAALIVARRPGGLLDRSLSTAALVLVSVPTLVWAVAGLGVAAATGVVPLGGGSMAGLAEVPLATRVNDFVHHLLLPCCVLATTMTPLFFLQSRGALMEVVPAEFARAARSRGLSRFQVLLKHCLRAAWIPVLSYAGGSVGRLLNGAFLVEVVTGWPGMGRLAWSALLARDSFLVLGVLLLAAVLMVAGNLTADIALAAADPRIRLEERSP